MRDALLQMSDLGYDGFELIPVHEAQKIDRAELVNET